MLNRGSILFGIRSGRLDQFVTRRGALAVASLTSGLRGICALLLLGALMIRAAVPAGYMIDWSSIDRTSWPISLCSEHPAPDPDIAPAASETSHHHMGAAATGTAAAGHAHDQSPADDHSKADKDESCAFSSLMSPSLLAVAITDLQPVFLFLAQIDIWRPVASLRQWSAHKPPSTGPPIRF